MPPNSSCELASDITCVSGRLMLQPPQPVGPRRRLGQQNRQLVAGLGTPAPVHLSADSPPFWPAGLGPGSKTTLQLLMNQATNPRDQPADWSPSHSLVGLRQLQQPGRAPDRHAVAALCDRLDAAKVVRGQSWSAAAARPCVRRRFADRSRLAPRSLTGRPPSCSGCSRRCPAWALSGARCPVCRTD